MKSAITMALMLALSIMMISCDSSTSSNENNNDNGNGEELILRAIIVNTGSQDADLDYSVLVDDPACQTSYSGGMMIGAGNSIPSILAESDPGATGISMEVTLNSGGPIRLAIEQGTLDSDDFFEGEELMFVPAGAGNTVTLEYSSN